MKRLRMIWSRILEMARAPMSDEATWVSHWIVVVASTSAIAALMGHLGLDALLWGLWISEAWLLFFVAREVHDWLMHRAAGHAMKRWTRDGIMDLIGPALHHVIWWAVYLG